MSAPLPHTGPSRSTPAGVDVTRWWWVRHAPVREDGGNIYGQADLNCDCSDASVFNAVARILPANAAWYASNLKRTHQTADAILAAGARAPFGIQQDAAFAEQDMGEWQGRNRAAFVAALRPEVASYWYAPADVRAPGGESFLDLYERTRSAIARIGAVHAGQDIVAVAHGGTIKAAIAVALGLEPKAGLTFVIDNCSVTRLDFLSSPGHAGWRIAMINQQPWIADPSHAAMHQPAGPEVMPPGKLA